MINKIRQKIKQFTANFSKFSDSWKLITVIVAALLAIALYFFVVKFAIWLVILAILIVFIELYFMEHTNQLWRVKDARKAVAAVIDGLTRKGFIMRNIFKLDGLDMPSEKLRTFNRAIYEFELAKSEVNVDIAKNEDVLTFEAQQSWQRYLLDNSERSNFMVQRVALIDRNSHYLMRIIFHNNKNCKMLKRDEVYNHQFKDKDFK